MIHTYKPTQDSHIVIMSDGVNAQKHIQNIVKHADNDTTSIITACMSYCMT
jgi:hypothetical protein